MNGVERIAAERKRQIEVEGYTPEHDAEHSPLELIAAARAYGCAAVWVWRFNKLIDPETAGWPWEPETFKPDPSLARNLEKSGALMAAALDQLPT